MKSWQSLLTMLHKNVTKHYNLGPKGARQVTLLEHLGACDGRVDFRLPYDVTPKAVPVAQIDGQMKKDSNPCVL